MVKDRPAIATCAERSPPLLRSTRTVTEPSPLPLAGEGWTQASLPTAVQAQPAEAATRTVVLVASELSRALLSLSV
jgi:hypothetical protein